MELVFKNLSDNKVVDLIPYVQEKIAERVRLVHSDDVKILVGTDSQNHGRTTAYSVVIVLHYGNNGGHVLYSNLSVKRMSEKISEQSKKFMSDHNYELNSMPARLWKEVELSLEVAQHLENNGVKKPNFIDLDINSNPKFGSNRLHDAAVGYVTGMGYTPRTKPTAFAASYCADKLCH